MRKFKCEVITTNTYEIELDETILNEEWMNDFSQYFFDVGNLEEVAEHLAWSRSVHKDNHIEGIGYYLQNGKSPFFIEEDKTINTAVNINIRSEDKDVEVDIIEIYG